MVGSDQMPTAPEWKYIHDAADNQVKKFTNELDKILRDLQTSINISDIEQAIRSGNPGYIIDIINWADQFDDRLLNQYEPVANAIMAITGTEAWNRLEIPISFTIRNPYAESWMAEHGAQLVTQVSEETKAAIRAVVTDAFQTGKPPREFAQRIREMVGLTERDAKAVLNYWEKLSEEADLTAARVNDMADSYSRRLLRKRALKIARQETMAASNQGVLQSWEIARDNGFILPESQKEWIAATASDRTCEYCRPMHGQTVGLNEQFQSELGAVMSPPLHIQCRCVVSLVTKRIV